MSDSSERISTGGFGHTFWLTPSMSHFVSHSKEEKNSSNDPRLLDGKMC